MSFYDNELIKEIKEKSKKTNNTNLYIPRVLRIVRATNYKKVSDVKIEEINKLHIQIIKSNQGAINLKIEKNKFFIETFLSDIKEMNKHFDFDILKYKSWSKGFSSRYKEMDYMEFLDNENNLKEYRRKYNIEQNKERKKKKKGHSQREKNPLVEEFLDISKEKNHWHKEAPHYNGYNFPENTKDSELWRKLFFHYLEHRERNGYEETKVSKITFNLFMNYIFFYLKIWNLKNNESFPIPLTPKMFHRTLYVNNSSVTSKDEKRPLTIIEILLEKSDSKQTINVYIKNIEFFFNFIEDFFEEEKEVWDSNFSNPIRKSDYFKTHNTKKTNKIIIPKNIYGKLKKYLYALESFGEHVQNQIIENNIENTLKLKEKSLNTENFGYIPVFFDNNRCYPIFEVPNTLLLKKRIFDINKLSNIKSEKVIEKEISSNTVIRALILMLNTGLRSAQVSWLDRNKWDVNEEGIIQAYYKLNVNTDKTKNHDWSTYIPHNVYLSLKKETLFQNAMKESFVNIPVNYKSREFSRFEDIICLFKSDSLKGLPIHFVKYWLDILWKFQNVINFIEKENYKLITISKPLKIQSELTSENNQYTPLSLKAIHTPHSMRATFCNHMAEYLERSEIAALVGHSSDLVTSEVYIKPEDSVLKEKIERAVDIFDNGVNSDYFDKDSSVHSKPHLKGSSLQKAFSENRDQTIELFNLSSISLNINKDSEEQSQKAIKILKEARTDQVIFESTHICPVGGICPQEVMGIIGEKRRCGLCPLALKCIDNLNPIYAKQRDLMREIQEDKEKLDLAIKNKESNISINNLEDKINLDIKELVSWKFSADILSKHYESLKENKDLDKKYYVEMPDMVKQHLQKVSISNEKEYLLTRIADSNAYSSYQNPENKYQAEMLRRNLIKNLNLFEYDDYYVSEEDKIEVFCSMIKNMLDANDIGLKQLVNSDCFKPIEQKKQLKELSFKDIKLLK